MAYVWHGHPLKCARHILADTTFGITDFAKQDFLRDVAVVDVKKEDQFAAGEEAYEALLAAGVDACLDDRKLRAGAKFKDADLIGFPVQIAIGSRGLAEGNVEVKRRGASDKELVSTGDVVDVVAGIVAEGLGQ